MRPTILLSSIAFASAALLGAPRMLTPQMQGGARVAAPAVMEAAAVTSSPKGFVITGGAGGVGYAYADELVKQGHWVVICDVKDPESAVQACHRHDPLRP